MRAYFCFLFVFIFCSYSFSQSRHLKLGKEEFQKERNLRNYVYALDHFEKAIIEEPNNAEGHYFLGCVYEELNSIDDKNSPAQNVVFTLKASAEFEKVNNLSPMYNGENITLDPYSKLTAIWGLLALKYLNETKIDSAKWAFSEGKIRGGFSDFFISIDRQLLYNCSTNAYLISAGENITFPMLYIQTIENIRNDLSVIDYNLLNTVWYPEYLVRKNKISLTFSKSELYELDKRPWKDSIITVELNPHPEEFKCLIKPNSENKYMLKNGLLLINLLQTTKFTKDIYFTTAVKNQEQMGLESYSNHFFLMNKVSILKNNNWVGNLVSGIHGFSFTNFEPEKIHNSKDEIDFINTIRNEYCIAFTQLFSENKKQEARDLYMHLRKNIPDTQYPYDNKEIEEKIKSYPFFTKD